MFLDPGSDPREGGPRLGDERATLTEFLRGQRLTLQLKCDGLDAGQLARRGVNRPRCPCWAWFAPGRGGTRLVPPPVRRV